MPARMLASLAACWAMASCRRSPRTTPVKASQQALRQQGCPVPAALAVPDQELSALKLGILEPKLRILQKPRAGYVEQLYDRPGGTFHTREQAPNL